MATNSHSQGSGVCEEIFHFNTFVKSEATFYAGSK